VCLSLVKGAVVTAHATQVSHTSGGFFVSDEMRRLLYEMHVMMWKVAVTN